MQTLDKNICLNFTKSIVDCFDEFVTAVEKYGDPVGDDELRLRLTHIGKTLQRIFNKWENPVDKKYTNCCSEETTCKEDESKIEVLERTDSWDDFEAIIASTVGDTESISKVTATEVTSTSRKSEFSSILDILTTPSRKEAETPESSLSCNEATAITRKEAEMLRRLKVENIKEEWIRGSKGLYIIQSGPGSWKCMVCKKEPLSDANMITHASGKSHIKNIGIYSREPSETRRNANDTNLNTDLSLNLSNVECEIGKKINGVDIIVPIKAFHCNACRRTLNSEEDLKLHILGGKHRKNCES